MGKALFILTKKKFQHVQVYLKSESGKFILLEVRPKDKKTCSIVSAKVVLLPDLKMFPTKIYDISILIMVREVLEEPKKYYMKCYSVFYNILRKINKILTIKTEDNVEYCQTLSDMNVEFVT